MWPSPPTNIGKPFLLFCSLFVYLLRQYNLKILPVSSDLVVKKMLVRVLNENG